MSVSVIVSNLNGARFLPKLLDSLAAQRDVDLEVIVVDRHSTDGSAEILKRYDGVTVLQEPPESGLVTGYTVGARVAKHEHLFFCNEDMWFDDRCLGRLEAAIDLPARVGASDPWQWTYDGATWIHGGVRFVPARWSINCPHPRYALDFNVPLPAGTTIPLPCAGAFMIHRDVLEELGGWDTSFFLDNEDIDLFIRAWQRDWRCVTLPEAKVFHAVGASDTQFLTGVRQSVRRRRYVSRYASNVMIPVKYFSAASALVAAAGWLVRFTNNVLRLRFTMAVQDLEVLAQVWVRLPAALRFRAANARFNRTRPGQRFFSWPGFLAR